MGWAEGDGAAIYINLSGLSLSCRVTADGRDAKLRSADQINILCRGSIRFCESFFERRQRAIITHLGSTR